MAEETNGKTLEEVYNSMTDEQKECCHALVGLALEEQDGDGGEDEEDESDMKHNVFDKDAGKQTVLKHSIDDINSIIKGAKTSGTLKAAFDNAGVEQGEIDELSHGIDNIDWLFPEDHLLDTTPRIIDKPDDWVSVVMGGVKHIPFSRFKSMFADLTPEDARAKGYVKGNYKIEEVFGLLRRSTGPTTVYKKQKLDRDDVSDITSFDVVSWLRNEMRYKLNRELALAYILGDGRQGGKRGQDRRELHPSYLQRCRPVYHQGTGGYDRPEQGGGQVQGLHQAGYPQPQGVPRQRHPDYVHHRGRSDRDAPAGGRHGPPALRRRGCSGPQAAREQDRHGA